MSVNFVFVVPSYNNRDWVGRNIGSIIAQKYTRWRVIYVDDASTDGTVEFAKSFVGKVDKQGSSPVKRNSDRFEFITTEKNLGPAASRYAACRMAEDDEVVCMLDGDDWLSGPNALQIIRRHYEVGFEATWGSYLKFEDGRTESTVLPRSWRSGWFCRHLRTMRAKLIKDIPLDLLKIDGEWIRCCSDLAESGWVEHKTKAAPIRTPTYIYNVSNSMRHPTSQYRTDDMVEYKTSVLNHVNSRIAELQPRPWE